MTERGIVVPQVTAEQGVLIVGADPLLAPLTRALEAAGVTVRCAPSERAIDAVHTSAPALIILLGKSARSGVVTLIDELAEVRGPDIEVLAVTHGVLPSEMRVMQRAATVDPHLGAARIAPLVVGVLQWEQPSAGKPLTLARRVDALRHILEHQLDAGDDADSLTAGRHQTSGKVSRISERPTPLHLPTGVGVAPRESGRATRRSSARAHALQSPELEDLVGEVAASLAEAESIEAAVAALADSMPPGSSASSSPPPAAEGAPPVSRQPSSRQPANTEQPTQRFSRITGDFNIGLIEARPQPSADVRAEDEETTDPGVAPAHGLGPSEPAAAREGAQPVDGEAAKPSARPPEELAAPTATTAVSAAGASASSAPRRSMRPSARVARPDWWARGLGLAALLASLGLLWQQLQRGDDAQARVQLPAAAPVPAASAPAVEPAVAPAMVATEAEPDPQPELDPGADTEVEELEVTEAELEAVEPQREPEPQAALGGEAQEDAPGDVQGDDEDAADARAHSGFSERHQRAAELVDEGQYYQRTGNVHMAALRYEQAVELMPRYRRALLAWVKASMRLSDAQKAVVAAEALVKAHPTQALHHRLLGDAYKRAGQLDRAHKAWRTAADSGDSVAPARLQ